MEESRKIDLNELENQLIIAKSDIDSLKSKKWYKSPSIVISITALTASLIFSFLTIWDKKEEKEETSFKERLSYVEVNIEKLLTEQADFQNFISNKSIGEKEKFFRESLWNAKSNLLIDKIIKEYDEDILNNINPNLLIPLGHNLQLTGRLEQARDIFIDAHKISLDFNSKYLTLRYLANIYALPSNFLDPELSRSYRKQEIIIVKDNVKGAFGNETIGRSYELWAMDEFHYLNNRQKCFELLDSAVFYYNLLPDHYLRKEFVLNQVINARLLIVDGIENNKPKDNWQVYYSPEKLRGTAHIVRSPSGIFLTIRIFKQNKLYMTFSGNGIQLNSHDLTFDITRTYFMEGMEYKGPQGGAGILNLNIKNSKSGTAIYYEYNSSPIKIKLS